MTANGKKKSKGENASVSTIITVVVSVIVILAVIYFVVNQFINIASKKSPEGSVPVAQESSSADKEADAWIQVKGARGDLAAAGSSSEGLASAPPSPSASSSSLRAEEGGQGQAEGESTLPSSGGLPAPLTEGEANRRQPDSFVGKTFSVNQRANVRSGPGTNSEILGGAAPGDSFSVVQAEMAGDAVWARGRLNKAEGSSMECWIYSYCLDTVPLPAGESAE